MIDDTLGDVAEVDGLCFSAKVQSIVEHRCGREYATTWSRNLRFLTFDDEGPDVGPETPGETMIASKGKLTGQCTRCAKRISPSAGHICCAHILGEGADYMEKRLKDYSNPAMLETEPYHILEEDGLTRRENRAPANVIDRAVAFAAENGLRMIWIDQECIEQDNEEEKEKGIQAMDLVYQRAHISIGLFETRLENQKHVEALMLLCHSIRRTKPKARRGPMPLKECKRLDLEALTEILEIITNDRWTTRAWILQEAFSAGHNMVVLFRRGKSVQTKGWDLFCHDLSLSDIAIQLDSLQKCIQYSIGFLSHSPWTKMSTDLLDRIRKFQPIVRRASLFQLWIPGTTAEWPIRLAVVANLCSYNVRLDTYELEKTQDRLSVCILALSLINGDFSLLYPEVYRQPKKLREVHEQRDQEFTWTANRLERLPDIDASTLNPSGQTVGRATNPFRVSNKGLSFPGFLWKISQEDRIDLASIKQKFDQAWQRVQKSKRAGARKKTLAATQVLFEILLTLRSRGELAAADAIWHSVMSDSWRAPGIKEIGVVDSVADFSERVKVENRRDMFELVSDREGGFYVQWLINRVMTDGCLWFGRLVRCSSDMEYWMFPPDIHPKEAEQRDKHDSLNTSNPRQDTDNLEDINVDNDVQQRIQSWDDHRAQSPGPSVMAVKPQNGASQTKVECHVEEPAAMTLTRNQVAASMLAKLSRLFMLQDDSGMEDPIITADSIAAAAMVLGSEDNPQFIERSLRAQRAVFDIDEPDLDKPVFILTPFDQCHETIPRLDTRTMAVSWIVEPTILERPILERPILEGSNTKTDAVEGFKTKGMVRGMWKIMQSTPLTSYTIV